MLGVLEQPAKTNREKIARTLNRQDRLKVGFPSN